MTTAQQATLRDIRAAGLDPHPIHPHVGHDVLYEVTLTGGQRHVVAIAKNGIYTHVGWPS
jgi:hypothetical protein